MDTHDLSKRTWGCNYEVQSIFNNGLEISLAGWKTGIKEGDYLILASGEANTRYKVSSITYCENPSDMWFAQAVFSPREIEQEVKD